MSSYHANLLANAHLKGTVHIPVRIKGLLVTLIVDYTIIKIVHQIGGEVSVIDELMYI